MEDVTYKPECTALTGNIKSGLLLSYLIEKTTPENNSIILTDKQLMKKLNLTINEVRSSKKKIKDFVVVTKKGLPAKTNYFVDWDKVKTEILEKRKIKKFLIMVGNEISIMKAKNINEVGQYLNGEYVNVGIEVFDMDDIQNCEVFEENEDSNFSSFESTITVENGKPKKSIYSQHN